MRVKVLTVLIGLPVVAAGIMWLLGYAIQGQLHILRDYPGGFIPTLAAGFIFTLSACTAAAVGFVLWIVLCFAYWFVEEKVDKFERARSAKKRRKAALARQRAARA